MSHSLVQIKHHLKLFSLISGVLILSLVLSFLVMSRGNKDHYFVFRINQPVSLKAWYFYLHCSGQCHASLSFPSGLNSSENVFMVRQTYETLPFQLQARYAFITHPPVLETDPVSLSLCALPPSSPTLRT